MEEFVEAATNQYEGFVEWPSDDPVGQLQYLIPAYEAIIKVAGVPAMFDGKNLKSEIPNQISKILNKKMKIYLNLFHAIVSEIHFWDKLNKNEKSKKLSSFLEDFKEIDILVDYFDDFSVNLRKKTLNFFLKSVISP